MTAAGHHHHRRGAGTALDRLALALFLFKGTDTAAAQIGHRRYRHMHHTQYRGIPFHQGNVHGELAVALDELLGAIQRVHQPETGPVLALGIGNTAGFFREHRNLRRQRLQARFNDLVRRHIRFRNRRLVILGFHPQVVTLVHRQNGITRFTGNLGERVQQGIKVGHFGFPIVQN